MTHTSARPWSWKFVDSGGYDCMTDAVYVCDRHGMAFAVLDLSAYGQTTTGLGAVDARARAEADAERICTAVNREENTP